MMNFYLFPLMIFQLLCLFPIATNAQGVAFEQESWATVKEKAKASNMPIFVDTYASWCEPCKWMDKNTFSQEEVGAFFKDNYVSYKMNIERGEGLAFAEMYQITSYPTLLYFNSDGELVHRIIGAFQAEELIIKSKDALEPENQIYTLQKEFENNERSPSFLKKYARALMHVGEDYSGVADTYIEVVGLDALLEEEHFAFLEHCLNDYKHKAYLHVVANKADFILAYGAERIERYLDAAFNIRCYEIIENGNGKTVIRSFLQDVRDILPTRVDYFKARIDFYSKRGDERKDFRLAKKYEKHCKDSKSLNSIARYTLDVYGKSKVHLESALEWVERAILLDENIYTLETKAMILLTLDRKEEALEVAKKQLKLSKEANEHLKETEALIKKIEQ